MGLGGFYFARRADTAAQGGGRSRSCRGRRAPVPFVTRRPLDRPAGGLGWLNFLGAAGTAANLGG